MPKKSLWYYLRLYFTLGRSLIYLYLHHYNIYRRPALMADTHDPTCPFCGIAQAFPPVEPWDQAPSVVGRASGDGEGAAESEEVDDETWNPEKTNPPTFVVLSTPDVIGFFDIAPLTRGHLLVASRRHRVKVGDLKTTESAEIGKWIPIVSRAMVKAVLGVDYSEGDWNVVQNNGPRAAQVIPHVHFHIVPRPASHGIPTLSQKSYVMFGRGQRNALDEEDTEVLVQEIRQRIADEVKGVWEREGIDLCDWSQNKDKQRIATGLKEDRGNSEGGSRL